jgi:hypothetical protein
MRVLRVSVERAPVERPRAAALCPKFAARDTFRGMARARSKLVGLALAAAMVMLPFCERPPPSKADATVSSGPSSASVSASLAPIVPTTIVSAARSTSERSIDPKARDTVIYPHDDTREFDVFRLPGKERQGILDRVFGRGQYLNSLAQCDPKIGVTCDSNDARLGLRKAHQFWPAIEDKAHGSFTSAKRPQMLFVISDRECGCVPPFSDTATLAVLEQGTLKRSELLEYRTRLVNVIDIDGDGQSEVVIGHNTAWQGVLAESLEIVRFAPTKLERVTAFDDVFRDTCDERGIDAGAASIKESTVHLYINPNGSHAFAVDQTIKPCGPPVAASASH